MVLIIPRDGEMNQIVKCLQPQHEDEFRFPAQYKNATHACPSVSQVEVWVAERGGSHEPPQQLV